MPKPVDPFAALEGVDRHEATSKLGGLEASDYWIIAALQQLKSGASAPAGVEVALGNVPGYEYGTGQARATGVDIGTPVDVILAGGFYSGFGPTSGAPVQIKLTSSSVDDVFNGVGMRTATIFGLRTATSTVYESEVLTVGGASSVGTWYRVNNVVGLTYGSAEINQGNVSVLNDGGGWEFARISAGDGQSLTPAFTVPFGKRMAIYDKILTTTRASGTDGSATVSLRARLNGGDPEHAVRVYDFTNESPVLGAGDIIVLPALTDLIWRVDAVGVDSTTVNITYPYVIVDEAV